MSADRRDLATRAWWLLIAFAAARWVGLVTMVGQNLVLQATLNLEPFVLDAVLGAGLPLWGLVFGVLVALTQVLAQSALVAGALFRGRTPTFTVAVILTVIAVLSQFVVPWLASVISVGTMAATAQFAAADQISRYSVTQSLVSMASQLLAPFPAIVGLGILLHQLRPLPSEEPDA